MNDYHKQAEFIDVLYTNINFTCK